MAHVTKRLPASCARLLLWLLLAIVYLYGVSSAAPSEFAVEIASPPIVKLGKPIVVNITITNTSNQDFVFYHLKNPSRAELDTSIVVWRSTGAKVYRIGHDHFVVSSGIVILMHPGAQRVESSTVNNVYDMTAPGTYFVRVDVSMKPRNGGPDVPVQSNTISVTVTS